MRKQFGMKSLLGLVLGAALVLACYVWFVRVPAWDRAGGMIGWSQASIESRLGPPAQVLEGDVGDANARKIRLKPPGACRTLVLRNFDGEFVVRLTAERERFVCFGSSWVNKGVYY
jgi:hypothetical protein